MATTEQRIKIDGEIYNVQRVYDGGYLPLVETDGGDFYVARDEDEAGEKASEYWRDMADNDPEEFACIIGSERLIAWGMGRSDSYGFSGLQDFLKAVSNVPEEQWASYDGNSCTVDRCGRLSEELGFTPTVAYRHN